MGNVKVVKARSMNSWGNNINIYLKEIRCDDSG
jgi:hypothetical protein